MYNKSMYTIKVHVTPRYILYNILKYFALAPKN